MDIPFEYRDEREIQCAHTGEGMHKHMHDTIHTKKSYAYAHSTFSKRCHKREGKCTQAKMKYDVSPKKKKNRSYPVLIYLNAFAIVVCDLHIEVVICVP